MALVKQTIHVGVIGFGTIGSGVVRALLERPALIERRTGVRLQLGKVCDRDLRRRRSVRVPRRLLTSDAREVLRDPRLDIVVELMGGLRPAKDYLLEAMRHGKHVVTANKALLAEHGPELFAAAHHHGVDVGFEASVGGGIPIIKALREGLVANALDSILGIVNGTSNYILTQMQQRGLSFAEALAEAQAHGYAERNPALDISGMDSAHKLAILARLGFGVPVALKDIYVEGIEAVSQADIRYAEEFGYVIKLLAIAKRVNHELEVRVHPTLLGRSHLLANVQGVYNAIHLHGDLVGSELFYGRGAGQQPTTSAVMADLVDVAHRIASGVARRVPPFFALRASKRRPLRSLGEAGPAAVAEPGITRVRPIDDVESRYYMRCSVIDRPGVLARIAGILGRHHISIASVSQKERRAARIVPVVFMTHEAREHNMRRALAEINRLPAVRRPSVAIRTEAPVAA